MTYQTPTVDLRLHLIAEGVVPAGQVFVNSLPDFSSLSSNIDYLVCVKASTGLANPKWLRDEWFVAFQVLGRDRSKSQIAEAKIWEIFNVMIGSPNVEIGDVVYLQFNSSSMPQFMGSLDNSQPLYSTTINFVAEGLKEVGNRQPLC